jgi:hypothetical protein
VCASNMRGHSKALPRSSEDAASAKKMLAPLRCWHRSLDAGAAKKMLELLRRCGHCQDAGNALVQVLGAPVNHMLCLAVRLGVSSRNCTL